MKTTTLLASALAIASLAALTGCGVGEASSTDQDAIRAATPVPVEIAHPYRSDIYATYEATAAIASDADAPVIARVSGQLVEPEFAGVAGAQDVERGDADAPQGPVDEGFPAGDLVGHLRLAQDPARRAVPGLR